MHQPCLWSHKWMVSEMRDVFSWYGGGDDRINEWGTFAAPNISYCRAKYGSLAVSQTQVFLLLANAAPKTANSGLLLFSVQFPTWKSIKIGWILFWSVDFGLSEGLKKNWPPMSLPRHGRLFSVNLGVKWGMTSGCLWGKNDNNARARCTKSLHSSWLWAKLIDPVAGIRDQVSISKCFCW